MRGFNQVKISKILKKPFTKEQRPVIREFKEEFKREILKDNYFKLAICSILLLLMEIVLYLLQENLYEVGPVILSFIAFNVLLIPFIMYIQSHIKKVNCTFALAVQYIYLAGGLAFAGALAIFIHGKTDLFHMYLLAVFAVAGFMYLKPVYSAVLFTSTYTLFAVVLSFFESDPSALFVICVNSLFSNILAWVLSGILWRMKTNAFINGKLLYNKNVLLKELNKKDSMTGLFNHVESLQQLEYETARASALKRPISLILADIDDFKSINDNYGHPFGDTVIKEVAAVLKSNVRSTDTVGRYGGDEFIIIMPDTDLKSARAFSERLNQALSSANLENDIKITLSGGISQFSDEPFNEFIKITDRKLYEAKSKGKDRFEDTLAEEVTPTADVI